MAHVVGLDLGRKSGWGRATSRYLKGWAPRTALEGPRASNEGLTYGEWSLGPDADWDGVYGKLWSNLDDLHEKMPIDVLAFESAGTHFKSANAIWSIVGLVVVCKTWCKVRKVTPHPVHNQAMKKHATGHGHAEKDRIMEAARRLGWDPPGENAGDALFVLDLCLTECHRR